MEDWKDGSLGHGERRWTRTRCRAEKGDGSGCHQAVGNEGFAMGCCSAFMMTALPSLGKTMLMLRRFLGRVFRFQAQLYKFPPEKQAKMRQQFPYSFARKDWKVGRAEGWKIAENCDWRFGIDD
jgi:hypothetical protein